ncbi:MAG: hypothetical protein FIA92_01280 [Chloroflexi bacterium]|nr:hypothetical protein [Chloroflexota bacterium]
MSAARLLPWLASAVLGLALALLVAGRASALDQVTLKVETWSSDNGHGYVGVKANGEWSPPAERRTQLRTKYYSDWQNMGEPAAYCHAWWVFVHRTADDSTVNFDNPISMVNCGPEPAIGVRPSGFGDLSLYLAVGIEPVTAPARSERTVTAELTAGWRDWIDDAINAYVRRDTVRVEQWTVDFGDGSRRTFPGDGSDRLATPHSYEAGEFDVVVTARVTGEAYGAVFTPEGVPYEEVAPFELDISNLASGTALPIEYVPPVVVPGGSPSGTMPGGQTVAPDAAGHAEIFWPRGLPCDLFVRAVVEEEGFMRSGGVVVGGATTRLLSYRYLGGENDRTGGSRAGPYDADQPLLMQWNTPLPDGGLYPIRVELTVETTYDDGTVRTFDFTGSIAVIVVYSSISY